MLLDTAHRRMLMGTLVVRLSQAYSTQGLLRQMSVHKVGRGQHLMELDVPCTDMIG
jgi:hypothetical protein